MRDAGILQSNPKPVKNSKSVVVADGNYHDLLINVHFT